MESRVQFKIPLLTDEVQKVLHHHTLKILNCPITQVNLYAKMISPGGGASSYALSVFKSSLKNLPF